MGEDDKEVGIMLGLYKVHDEDGWWVTNGTFLWFSCRDEAAADFILKEDHD